MLDLRELTEPETVALIETLGDSGPATGVFDAERRLLAVVHPYRDPQTVIGQIVEDSLMGLDRSEP